MFLDSMSSMKSTKRSDRISSFSQLEKSPVGILKNSKEKDSESKSLEPDQKKKKNVQFIEEKRVSHQ